MSVAVSMWLPRVGEETVISVINAVIADFYFNGIIKLFKFGQAKIAYRLDNIKAKLKQTSESWIASIALVLNLVGMRRQALVSLIMDKYLMVEIIWIKFIFYKKETSFFKILA